MPEINTRKQYNRMLLTETIDGIQKIAKLTYRDEKDVLDWVVAEKLAELVNEPNLLVSIEQAESVLEEIARRR